MKLSTIIQQSALMNDGKPWEAIVGIVAGPPLVLLAIGGVIVWIIGGFLSDKPDESQCEPWCSP